MKSVLHTPPYQHHSETSHTAALLAEPLARTDRELVLAVLKAAGSRGMTDEELQDVTGLSPSTQRPRRIELCKRGKVFATSKTRQTKSGRPATVWEASCS